MNTYQLKLDLNKGPSYSIGPAYGGITIRQGDKNGTTIEAELYDHGERLTQTGLGAYFVMPLPDREHYYRKAATYSDGTATVTIDETQAASVPGVVRNAYFELTQGTTVIASTQSFFVSILADALADKEVPEGYDTAIQDAIDALTEATDSIPEQVQSEVDAQLVAHPEWTTTVQDNSVTDAKLIQKGGILQREQWLETMLPNIPRKTTSEADVHSVTDSAGGGPLGISVYGRSTQDGTPTPESPVPIVSVQPDGEGNVSLWAQGRNVAHPLPGTRSNRGITATVAEDGWITISGTSTATSSAILNIGIGSSDQTARVIEGAPTFALFIDNEGALVSGEIELQFYGSDGEVANKGRYATESRTIDGFTDYISRICVFLRAASNGKTYSGRFRFSLVRSDQIPTAYVPYVESVTPIDLDGHELRSLPDGTRDEVTVDEWGHAVLTQRVGHAIYDGTQAIRWFVPNSANTLRRVAFDMAGTVTTGISSFVGNARADKFKVVSNGDAQDFSTGAWSLNVRANGTEQVVFNVPYATFGSQDEALAWFAANPVEVDYQLATPVTIDLGHLDPALLPAPDLTAYVVPSAPSVLRYGFDVAAAIAEIATS